MRTKKACLLLVLAFLPIISPGILIPTLGGTGTNHARQIIQTSPGPNATFQYVVAILMENKNLGDIIGNSCCPYLNRLANDSGFAKNYFDVSNLGSLPNYMGLVAANTLSTWSTCNSTPLQCNGWPSGGDTEPTILDRIESAGLDWKAYVENYPGSGSGSNYSTGGCYLSDSGDYVARHDPFVWFSHIINNSTECSKIINSGTNGATLISDLGSNSTASRFMWLTPNLCNDSATCTASVGDTYLSQIVPQILNSPVFKTNRAALYITWDEGSNSGHVPALWAGSAARNNYTSILSYNHFSLLKTIESVWGLTSLTASDSGASAMTEFFNAPPDFALSANPISVVANTSAVGSSNITVTPLNGFTGTVTLTDTVPSGLTCGAITPSSVSASGTATVSCSASVTGNYTLTITGTSTPLVHTSIATFQFQDFTIVSTPANVTVSAGVTANSTIQITPLNGFAGTVALATNSTSCTLNPTNITGSGNASLSCSGFMAGNHTVTVSGTSGTLFHTTMIVITVQGSGSVGGGGPPRRA